MGSFQKGGDRNRRRKIQRYQQKNESTHKFMLFRKKSQEKFKEF